MVANPHYAVRRYISVGGDDDGFQFTPLGVILKPFIMIMRNCWQIHLMGRSIVVSNPHYAVRRYISVGGKTDDGFQFTPLGVIFAIHNA